MPKKQRGNGKGKKEKPAKAKKKMRQSGGRSSSSGKPAKVKKVTKKKRKHNAAPPLLPRQKQGYLLKRNQRVLLRGWKRRWFVLSDHTLYCFADEHSETHFLHAIDLSMLADPLYISWTSKGRRHSVSGNTVIDSLCAAEQSTSRQKRDKDDSVDKIPPSSSTSKLNDSGSTTIAVSGLPTSSSSSAVVGDATEDGFLLEIRHPDGIYEFSADTQCDRREWVNALRTVVLEASATKPASAAGNVAQMMARQRGRRSSTGGISLLRFRRGSSSSNSDSAAAAAAAAAQAAAPPPSPEAIVAARRGRRVSIVTIEDGPRKKGRRMATRARALSTTSAVASSSYVDDDAPAFSPMSSSKKKRRRFSAPKNRRKMSLAELAASSQQDKRRASLAVSYRRDVETLFGSGGGGGPTGKPRRKLSLTELTAEAFNAPQHVDSLALSRDMDAKLLSSRPLSTRGRDRDATDSTLEFAERIGEPVRASPGADSHSRSGRRGSAVILHFGAAAVATAIANAGSPVTPMRLSVTRDPNAARPKMPKGFGGRRFSLAPSCHHGAEGLMPVGSAAAGGGGAPFAQQRRFSISTPTEGVRPSPQLASLRPNTSLALTDDGERAPPAIRSPRSDNLSRSIARSDSETDELNEIFQMARDVRRRSSLHQSALAEIAQSAVVRANLVAAQKKHRRRQLRKGLAASSSKSNKAKKKKKKKRHHRRRRHASRRPVIPPMPSSARSRLPAIDASPVPASPGVKRRLVDTAPLKRAGSGNSMRALTVLDQSDPGDGFYLGTLEEAQETLQTLIQRHVDIGGDEEGLARLLGMLEELSHYFDQTSSPPTDDRNDASNLSDLSNPLSSSSASSMSSSSSSRSPSHSGSSSSSSGSSSGSHSSSCSSSSSSSSSCCSSSGDDESSSSSPSSSSSSCSSSSDESSMSSSYDDSSGPSMMMTFGAELERGPLKFCSICFAENLADGARLTQCGHAYCEYCLRKYCQVNIAEATTLIPCPDPSCAEFLSTRQIKSLVDEKTLARFERFVVLNQFRDNPDTRWCPSCESPNLLPGAAVNKKRDAAAAASSSTAASLPRPEFIECSECGTEIHFACGLERHDGRSCEDVSESSQVRQWALGRPIEGGSSRASPRAQPCPFCSCWIEKSKGCNDIRCGNCHRRFCWICLEPMTIDHYDKGPCKGLDGHSRGQKAFIYTAVGVIIVTLPVWLPVYGVYRIARSSKKANKQDE
jgi:IBR domain/IBR domain, a half RING-finger domain